MQIFFFSIWVVDSSSTDYISGAFMQITRSGLITQFRRDAEFRTSIISHTLATLVSFVTSFFQYNIQFTSFVCICTGDEVRFHLTFLFSFIYCMLFVQIYIHLSNSSTSSRMGKLHLSILSSSLGFWKLHCTFHNLLRFFTTVLSTIYNHSHYFPLYRICFYSYN